MNSKQRMAAAMRHEQVDRVPVMCQLALGHYLLNTDLTPIDIWFTSEGFASALITLQQRYSFDGILINLLGTDPNWKQSVQRIETAVDGSQTVFFHNGDVARCPCDDNVHHFPARERSVLSLGDVDPNRLFYDDPHGLGGLKYPFYFGLEPYRTCREDYWPDYIFRTVEMVVERVGQDVSVHSEVFSPWTQFMELFGYEQALMHLLDDPSRVHAILDAYTAGTVDLALRQAERGVDAVLISSAFAGGGFISPHQYEEFVVPYEHRIARAVAEAGVIVYTHTCGKIGDRLELMVQTGIHGIDTLDPPPLGTVELADAKRRVGDELFFKGNIDPVHTLLNKDREFVRRNALERLAIGSRGGGYILSSACSVPPHVRPDNLTVLVDAAREFGTPRN